MPTDDDGRWRPRREDDDRWRRMPVPQPPPELGVVIRQFRETQDETRRGELMREIALKAKTQPAELARLLQQWLHEED